MYIKLLFILSVLFLITNIIKNILCILKLISEKKNNITNTQNKQKLIN